MAWCVKSIDETESKRKPSKPSRSTQKCRLELLGQASLAFVSGCVCQDRKVAHNVQEEADNLDVLVVEDAAASERPASQLTSQAHSAGGERTSPRPDAIRSGPPESTCRPCR
jgi:hypothetical protein